MLTDKNVRSYLDPVKRHLHITWNDTDTEQRLIDQMFDAEAALNHKLGAEINYFVPGAERRLYLAYMLYSWNNCLEQFDRAYTAEILQIRHKYAIAANKWSEGEDDET